MAEAIRYAVDLTDRVQHLVRVTLTIPADLAADARVVLPVWTPGSYVVRDYVRHVQWIRARDRYGAAVAVSADGISAWRLPGHLDGPVDLELELYANELTVRTNHVDDHHALLIPAATFPYVEGGEDRPHEVRIPPSPPEHRVWSLLPAAGVTDTYVAADRDHLVDSAFEVGDLPHVAFEVASVPHAFVWAGHGGAPDLDRIAHDAAAIGAAAVALFGGGLPVERYTFLAAGWDEGGGGLEHRDGAVLQIPVRAFQDEDQYARVQSLLAHEYLHLWNGKRLTPAALTRPDYERPTPTDSLWVAEGWTAYYDDLLPLRAGLWPVRGYLDRLHDTWDRVRDTPGVSLQPLRRASYEAWTKHYVRDENTPNVTTDYYAHGALVAWELDLRLRQIDPGGDGLDAVLRLLWQRHADDVVGQDARTGDGGQDARTGDGAVGRRGGVAGYTEDDVLAAIAEVGGDPLAELADDRVGTPGLPDLDGVVEAVGLTVEATDGPTPPHLGVVTADDGSAGVTIVSVLREGPAWQAGVTGGDRLVAIDGVTLRGGALTSALLASAPDDRVELTLVRGPRLLTLPVVLGEPRPASRLVAVAAPSDAQREAFRRWTGRALERT